MYAIGLMSGTSLDGVDAALVKFDDDTDEISLVKFITLPYDKKFKEKLMRNLNDETAKLSELCSLNFELGDWFVKAIDVLLEDTGIYYSDIAYVASHGQTFWHNPRKNGDLVPSTLQLGEGSVICAKTKIITITNFRSADIAAGGEGAPLVPMSEYILFKSNKKSRILQNIGGISNLTFLKKGCSLDEIVAFDCGPGNVMIDYFTQKYFGKPYDENGDIASSGTVQKHVVDYLRKDGFYKVKPPKSTGRERYSESYMEKVAQKCGFDKMKKEDVIASVSYFTAWCMAYQYEHFIGQYDEIILSGGGSHNEFVRRSLEDITMRIVQTQDDIGYNSDAKEAMAFAILGNRTIHGEFGNVKSATGAKDDVVLGNIYLNK